MLISLFVDSNIREDDSIVEVLVVKDKLKRFRELDKYVPVNRVYVLTTEVTFIVLSRFVKIESCCEPLKMHLWIGEFFYMEAFQ